MCKEVSLCVHMIMKRTHMHFREVLMDTLLYSCYASDPSRSMIANIIHSAIFGLVYSFSLFRCNSYKEDMSEGTGIQVKAESDLLRLNSLK